MRLRWALGLKQDAMLSVLLYSTVPAVPLAVATRLAASGGHILGRADLNRLHWRLNVSGIQTHLLYLHFSGQPGCNSAWALGNSGMKYHGRNAVLR